MCEKVYKIGLVLTLLFLLVSCATVSPFYNKEEEFSTVAEVFGNDGEVVILADMHKVTPFVTKEEHKKIAKRMDTFAFAQDEKGNFLGAFEGRFPHDTIRLITGETIYKILDLTVIQPDAGLMILSRGDINEAKKRIIDERKVVTTKEELKEHFSHAISIFGKNLKGLNVPIVKGFFNFTEVEVVVDVVEDKLLANGYVLFPSNKARDSFNKAFKTVYVASLRKRKKPVNAEEIDKCIIETDNKLTYKNLEVFI